MIPWGNRDIVCGSRPVWYPHCVLARVVVSLEILVLVGWLCGCSVHADPSNTTFACDAEHPCPEGYVCSGTGFCTQPDSRCGLTDALADTFDDGWRGEEWWASVEEGGAVLAEEGGQAVARPAAGSNEPSIAYYQSVEWFVWDGSRVYVEVVESVHQVAGTRAFLALAFDNNVIISMEQEGDQLFFRRTSEGNTVTLGSVHYDPAAHRWWQLRAPEGQTVWETSSDGRQWVARFEEARPQSLKKARIRFGASAEPGIADPGAARFDNLNGGVALGHTCKVEQIEDDFEGGGNDGWRRSYEQGGASRRTADGVARVTLPEGVVSEAAYMSSTAYTLVGSGVSIEIVEVPEPQAGLSVWFRGVGRGGHYIGIRLEQDTLFMEQSVAGQVTVLATVRYSPEEHVFWGLGERNGKVFVSTSPDRQQWRTHATVEPLFDVSAVAVAFGATATAAPATTAVATFDNVR